MYTRMFSVCVTVCISVFQPRAVQSLHVCCVYLASIKCPSAHLKMLSILDFRLLFKWHLKSSGSSL